MINSCSEIQNCFYDIPLEEKESDKFTDDSTNDRIDIFDYNLTNGTLFTEDSIKFDVNNDYEHQFEFNRFCTNNKYQTINQLCKIDTFRELYFVHYVNDETTLQSLSITYKCSISEIRKVNRLESENINYVQIKKFVLVPLCHCKFPGNFKIYQAPGAEKSIYDEYEIDVETFINESVPSNNTWHADSSIKCCDLKTQPGAVISRVLLNDVTMDRRISNDYPDLDRTNFLFGFTVLNFIDSFTKSNYKPAFIVKINGTSKDNKSMNKDRLFNINIPEIESCDIEKSNFFGFDPKCKDALKNKTFSLEMLYQNIRRKFQNSENTIELHDLTE
ncbi:hypothetical protein WICMUC_001253 [Wickerhamomyces mucosus]|uniref:LysM domain-containing protein n=1 Tax=Wickerhamomyces mucosus TaxID=1378264 RepID=A0A9P8PVF2_9ASCO|nr:hypothetical protein WICMUC_001253 [Wickerhamomyces mucosus]